MTTSSWYRRSLWNYKGSKEYTRTGYEAAATRFVEQDLDVDCSDRHYMITGSNSGIGLQTALAVARRGGIIHMVCRNLEAATSARSEIITTTGNDKIHLHIVDLAKPREVVTWAQRFAAQHERLHVLVHNAGCMVHERQVDEDGVETNFAVNTLAVHIITLTLMPLLERCEDARVIIVSSAGMLCVRLEPHDLMHANMEPFDGRLVYSQNKRQQVVLGLWYAQRYNKIHFSSMHPGWADTPAVRTSLPQFHEMMKDNLRTPAQGADTAVWLAISKAALKHPSGLFFQDREPVSSHLPLAWTKSTIEEEDFLVTNIQNAYTKIYERMFPKAADGQETSPTTSQSQADTPQSEAAAAAAVGAGAAVGGAAAAAAAVVSQTSSEEGGGLKNKEEEAKALKSKVEETSLTVQPPKPEIETSAFPVLPPPPPPAGKVTSSKSEVREVAEIHAPPASSQKKDTAPETHEEPKPSQTHEEKIETPEEKIDTPEEKKTDTAEEKKTDKQEEKKIDMQEEKKTDTSQEKKTDVTEEKKTDMQEEKKIDPQEEKKTDPQEEKKTDPQEEKKTDPQEEKKTDMKEEEKKTDTPEEKKTDTPEEKKTDTPEDKGEDTGASALEKEEERTEALQEDKEKEDTPSSPPAQKEDTPSSPPAQKEDTPSSPPAPTSDFAAPEP